MIHRRRSLDYVAERASQGRLLQQDDIAFFDEARKIALPGSILLFVDVPRQNVDRARVQRIRRGRRVWFGDALPRVTG